MNKPTAKKSLLANFVTIELKIEKFCSKIGGSKTKRKAI